MRSGDGGGGGGGDKEVININCGLRAIIAGNVHYLCTRVYFPGVTRQ